MSGLSCCSLRPLLTPHLLHCSRRCDHHLSSSTSWHCPSLASQTQARSIAIRSTTTKTITTTTTTTTTTCEQEVELPFLMVTSKPDTEGEGKGKGCYHLYGLTDHMSLITFNRGIHLPELGGHHLIGSSQGYVFSVDPTSADLHATCLSSLHSRRLPLPPTISLPDVAGVVRRPDDREIVEYVIRNVDEKPAPEPEINYFENRRKGTISRLVNLSQFDEIVTLRDMQLYNYRKAILSPSLDTAVVLVYDGKLNGKLAFARIGDRDSHDTSWVPLRSPVQEEDYKDKIVNYCDMIFHDGRLHAVDEDGRLAGFDLSSNGDQILPEFVRPNEGPSLEDSEHRKWRRFLVESPDGKDLFSLIGRGNGKWKTHGFQVFKLDKGDGIWNQVESIGDIALFVGWNHSMSLSARDFPGNIVIKPNCIYFTESWEYFRKCRGEVVNVDMGVFNLDNGTIQHLTDNSVDGHDWLSAMWFVSSTC